MITECAYITFSSELTVCSTTRQRRMVSHHPVGNHLSSHNYQLPCFAGAIQFNW